VLPISIESEIFAREALSRENNYSGFRQTSLSQILEQTQYCA